MTTTSTYEELNTQAGELPDFTTDHPCPDYCNLPLGHQCDSLDPQPGKKLRQCRGHGGPTAEFGEHVSGGSTEYSDEPGVFHHSVWVVHEKDYESPAELMRLAEQIANAAAWLMKQREKQS